MHYAYLFLRTVCLLIRLITSDILTDHSIHRLYHPFLNTSRVFNQHVPNVLLSISFTYSDPSIFQMNSLTSGGELSLRLKESLQLTTLCSFLIPFLPCIRIRQCNQNNALYDLDFNDYLLIPDDSVIQITILNPKMHISVNKCFSIPKNANITQWRLVLQNDNVWKVHTILWNIPSNKVIEYTRLSQCINVTSDSINGFHHSIRVSTNYSAPHLVTIFLPKDVFVDKYELYHLYNHNQLPSFMFFNNISDVESPAHLSHPQILILYKEMFTDINCVVPIHLRYVYPKDDGSKRQTVQLTAIDVYAQNITDSLRRVNNSGITNNTWIKVSQIIEPITLSIPIGSSESKQIVLAVTLVVLLVSTSCLSHGILTKKLYSVSLINKCQ